MDKSVLKYIENEREISKYNLSMLERRECTPARKRLIEIEKDFLKIPFEEMKFENIDQIISAINLYRQSRRLFYIKYKNLKLAENSDLLIKKINFLRDLSSELMIKKVQEINLVQDFDFYNQYVNYLSRQNKTSIEEENSILKKKTLKELIKEEPAILAKKRARMQAIFYSIGLAISDFLDNLNISENSDFQILNSFLDENILGIEKNMYKNYNKALDILPNKLLGTMGENFYIKKMQKLRNILNWHVDEHMYIQLLDRNFIKFDKPKIINISVGNKNLINHSYKKDLDRKTKNKSLGILFPIERVGNEKMKLSYLDIYYSGINISELFLDTISNVKVIKNNKLVYYKAVFLKPLWSLLNYAGENKEYHFFLSKLLGENLDNINLFNNIIYIEKINSKIINDLEVDLSSEVLIPNTRSEEESFDEIKSSIFKKLYDIKISYKNIN